MTLPLGTVPYAQLTSSLEAPPPYHFPGVIMHAFVVDVSLSAVQAYYDRTFNLGDQAERGYVYKTAPAWPYGLLLFAQYPQMLCTPNSRGSMGATIPYAYRGALSQTEVFLAIPAVRYGTTLAGAVVDTTVDWSLPFIVVENASSASCGREMLGLGKQLADVKIREWQVPGSFYGTVEFPGWALGAAGEKQQMLQFLQVRTDPPMLTDWGQSPLTSPWSLLARRFGGDLVDGLASLMGYAQRASLGTLPLEMRTVSMKQFRDAATPERAIFQSLVTCRTQYSGVEDFRVFNENDVSIVVSNYQSFRPILEVFLDGSTLNPMPLQDPQIPVTCRAAFSMRATIDFDQMRTIYIRQMDPGPGNALALPSRDLVAPWARPWIGLLWKLPQ